MAPSRLAFLALALLAPLAGCPKHYPKPAHEPSLDEALKHLSDRRDAVHSYQVNDSTMDYWVGNQRFRGTVLVMGEQGAKVRMNALRPDGAVAADLACDGANFVFVDEMNNCVLTGPCNEQSIAALVRVPLAPDDFLALAVGTTPVVDDAKGQISWDDRRGAWRLELTGAGSKQQTILLDDRDGKGTWDVVHTEMRGSDGKPMWTVDHTDYGVIGGIRVPGKSHVTTPAEKSDLLVEWGGDRQVNPELAPQKFELTPPAGLPACGQQAPAKSASAAPNP